METRKEYTQQTITRVVDFGKRHADLFPKKSAAGELIDALEEDLKILDQHSNDQISGDGAVRKSRASKNEAHQALLVRLDRIDQTARALKHSDFFLPPGRSDGALIKAGKTFAVAAVAVKSEFIKHGLAADFIEQLNTAAQDLDSAVRDLAINVEKRRATNTAIDNAFSKTLDDLARFDALVGNTLSDNEAIMAEWEHARRVGRPPVRRKKNSETQPEPQPDPGPSSQPATAPAT
jgi:outer membrane murein-binding lipoprotein Lpp